MPNSGAGQKVAKTTPANPIMPMTPNHSMASTSSQGSYPMPQTPMNYPMGQSHERNQNDASRYYEQQYQVCQKNEKFVKIFFRKPIVPCQHMLLR
jgi:hypothetical protein